MAGRGDELDAEAAQVPADRIQDVYVGLAGVAAAGAHLAQLERATQKPLYFFIQGAREFHPRLPFLDDQILSLAHGHAIVPREGDGASRASLDTVRAKEAFAEIEPRPLAKVECVGRAGFGAGAAIRRAGGLNLDFPNAL